MGVVVVSVGDAGEVVVPVGKVGKVVEVRALFVVVVVEVVESVGAVGNIPLCVVFACATISVIGTGCQFKIFTYCGWSLLNTCKFPTIEESFNVNLV